MKNNVPTITMIFAVLFLGGSWMYASRQSLTGQSNASVAATHSATQQASVVAMTVASSTTSGISVDPNILAQSAPPPSGYVEYRNEKYHFSLYHSPQAVVKEYDEGGGAVTITFENFQKVRGLQIFIVPYNEMTISEARFKADVPSGVRTNVANTYVNGVKAVTFNGYDSALGDTREVWFIRGGYLYEVTTFKGVADWFVPIMQTWHFI